MSGFNNQLKEIPKAIFKSLKRKVTRHDVCKYCSRKKHVDDLERHPFLGGYVCKGSTSDSDCDKINGQPQST